MHGAVRGASFLLLGVALVLSAAGTPAIAGDTGSRILDSPSRDVYRRDESSLRTTFPGGNLTKTRSLSGMIGDLGAAGGRGAAAASSRSNCVLHHERLERSTRQLFATRCDPTVDVDTGYPAFTTR